MKRIAALCLSLTTAACAPTQSADPWERADLAEVWRLGTRAVALTEQHRFEDAAAEWERVLEEAPHWTTARINLGIATLNTQAEGSEERARRIFEGVLASFPDNPWAHYCLGLLLERAGEPEAAERHFTSVLGTDPGDPDTYYRLGSLFATAVDRPEAAVSAFRRALSGNPVLASAWYGLAQVHAAAGDTEASEAAMREFLTLKESGAAVERSTAYGHMGFYAGLIRPTDWALPAPPSGAAPAAYEVVWTDASAELGLDRPELAHGGPGTGSFEDWWGGGGRPSEVSGGVAVVDLEQDGDHDLVLAHWGPGPDVRVLRNEGGGLSDASAELGLEAGDARTIALAAADFDGNGRVDLWLGRDGADRVLAQPADGERTNFAARFEGVEEQPAATFAGAVGDIDQDGDLDLLVGRRDGARFYRWEGDRFQDLHEEAPLDAADPVLSVLLCDVDGDGDLDAMLGTPRPRVWINDRLWRLRESSLPGVSGADRPLASVSIGDVDADGLTDWLATTPMGSGGSGGAGGASALLVADLEGGYRPNKAWPEVARPRQLGASWLDADRDGDLDALLVGEAPALLLQGADGEWVDWTESSQLAELAGEFTSARGHALFDLEGDGDLDLVVLRNGSTPLVVRNDTAPGPDWIGVVARGVADATRARGRSLGIGARVEVVAGNRTRTRYAGLGGGFASTAPETNWFSLAGAERADVRIQWADGVVQSEFDLAGGQVHVIEQVDREAASCPVLFYWDGTRMRYLADFLGGGGVGFLVEPGFYGPPDPEEVVRIGSDLAPRGESYEIRVAEPMEEATYLDEVTLLQVTHPAGTEVYPEERFATAEPLSTGRPLLIETARRLFPERAVSRATQAVDATLYLATGDGPREDRERLLEVDRDFAGPLSLNRRLLGFAGPWATELEFAPDAELLAADEPLFLFVNGWIEYPYSRFNLAAYQQELRMQSWSLEVPAEDGTGWTVVWPEFGYMAGKPRTMAIDLSPYLDGMRDGDRWRFRLSSNLAVYLDQAFVARDVSAGRLQVTEVHPSAAELRYLGFPREYSPDGAHPLLYDYEQRDTTSDFKALAGLYSAYGDVLDLVSRRDDRFAIYGRGEEVAFSFPVAAFPAVDPGESATWLLRAKGYCKDMCPLTSYPTTLAPLPFESMTEYPPAEALGPDHPSRLTSVNRRAEPERRPTR